MHHVENHVELPTSRHLSQGPGRIAELFIADDDEYIDCVWCVDVIAGDESVHFDGTGGRGLVGGGPGQGGKLATGIVLLLMLLRRQMSSLIVDEIKSTFGETLGLCPWRL